MLTFLSLLLAVAGAFLVPASVAGVSLGVVVAVVGNYVIALQARRVGGSTSATALPAVAWLALVIVLASGRREGDVVLTGSASSLSFIVLGAVSAAVGIARRPRGRREPDPETAEDPLPD